MLTWQAKYYQQCACRGRVNPNFIEYLSTSPNPWVCLLNKFCSIHFWWHVTRQSKLCGFWKGRYEEQHTPLIKDEPCNVWIPPKSDDVIYEEPLIWRYRRGFQLLKCSKMLSASPLPPEMSLDLFNTYFRREKISNVVNKAYSKKIQSGKWSWKMFCDLKIQLCFTISIL